MTDIPKRNTRRRGNGEGSVFRRSDGRWTAIIAVGYGANGKRLRRTIYGATKKAVQDELTRLQHRNATGQLTATSKVTVSQYLDRWLEDVLRLTARDSTYRRYKQLVRLHVNPRIGGVRLHRLTAGDVQGIYSTMETAGLSARTRQFVHSVLHKAVANAVKWGLVTFNVCDQLEPPRAPKATMQVLTPAQAGAFLKAAAADRLYALYVLAVAVGMRQGELLGLLWENVDLEAGRLSVRHTLNDQGELAEPKTTRSRRSIELPAVAVEALWSHKRAMAAAGHGSSSFVFVDTKGGPLRRQNVLRRSFRGIVKAAECPAVRFHDLRHSAATMMLAEGIHPKVVQETLGHSTIAITLDTYSHVLPTMQRDAADRMNRVLTPAKVAG